MNAPILIFISPLILYVYHKKWGYIDKNLLLFHVVLFIYLYKLLDITIFGFVFNASEILAPSYPLQLNLIPFFINGHSLTREFYQNIFLTIPYGFLIPVIIPKNYKFSKFWLLVGTGLLIEIVQYFIGFLIGYYYRIIDINDVIANAIGALMGYFIFFNIFYLFVSRSASLFKVNNDKFINSIITLK